MLIKANLEQLHNTLFARFPSDSLKVEYGPDKVSELDTIVITIDGDLSDSRKKIMSSFLAKELKQNYRSIRRVVYRRAE